MTPVDEPDYPLNQADEINFLDKNHVRIPPRRAVQCLGSYLISFIWTSKQSRTFELLSTLLFFGCQGLCEIFNTMKQIMFISQGIFSLQACADYSQQLSHFKSTHNFPENTSEMDTVCLETMKSSPTQPCLTCSRYVTKSWSKTHMTSA